MTALPASTDFTGAAITEAQFKTAISDQRAYLAGLFGADGLNATALSTLGALLNGISSQSGAYTVVAGDKGKLIDATTGTWTLTLTAAATLGAGFAFAVKNSGSGVITIDPNSSELIDGVSTITLAATESCCVICSGTAFRTVSKAATLTSAAIITALGYNPGDIGISGIGAVAYAFPVAGSIASGATTTGSNLDRNNTGSSYGFTGTWKNITGITVNAGTPGMFQRTS